MTIIVSDGAIPSLDQILQDRPLYLDVPIDQRETSAEFNIPEPTLETLRCRGGGPEFLKRGKRVFYTRRDVLQWLNRGLRRSTSDTGAA